jgi:hypothetical protein
VDPERIVVVLHKKVDLMPGVVALRKKVDPARIVVVLHKKVDLMSGAVALHKKVDPERIVVVLHKKVDLMPGAAAPQKVDPERIVAVLRKRVDLAPGAAGIGDSQDAITLNFNSLRGVMCATEFFCGFSPGDLFALFCLGVEVFQSRFELPCRVSALLFSSRCAEAAILLNEAGNRTLKIEDELKESFK